MSVVKNRDEWLAGLQIGDKVAIRSGWGYAQYRSASIERITNTQVITDGSRFYRKNGRLVGGSNSYHFVEIVELTPTIRELIVRRNLTSQLAGTNWTFVSTDALAQIATILNADRIARESAKKADAND